MNMDKIRLGIIGVGNMGYGHLKNICDGLCPRIEVTAFSDPVKDMLKRAKELCPKAAAFEDTNELLDSGLIDAALIAVPHYDHPAIAKECFKRGIHVMTEKPAGVYTRQVREMNDKLILKNDLKAARQEKGLSQAELANMVGVSRNTISSIETGQFQPTAKLALVLCLALDQRFEDLFFF